MKRFRLIFAASALLTVMVDAGSHKTKDLTNAENLALIIAEIQGEALKAIAISRLRRASLQGTLDLSYHELLHGGTNGHEYLKNCYAAFDNTSSKNVLLNYVQKPVTQAVEKLGDILQYSSDTEQFKDKLLAVLEKQINKFVRAVGSDKNMKLVKLPSRNRKGLTNAECAALFAADIREKALEAIGLATVNHDKNANEMRDIYVALVKGLEQSSYRPNRMSSDRILKNYIEDTANNAITRLMRILKLSTDPTDSQDKIVSNLRSHAQKLTKRLSADDSGIV